MTQSEPFIGHLLLNPPALTAIVREPRKVPPLSKAKCGRMEAYVGRYARDIRESRELRFHWAWQIRLASATLSVVRFPSVVPLMGRISNTDTVHFSLRVATLCCVHLKTRPGRESLTIFLV